MLQMSSFKLQIFTQTRFDRRRTLMRSGIVLCAIGAGLASRPVRAVERVSVSDARDQTLAGEMILVDIRTPGEWVDSGVGDVAVEIDMRSPDFITRVRELSDAYPDRQLAFICATGGRSSRLARGVEAKGLKSVVDVSAGMHGAEGWLARGLPVRKPAAP